MRSRSAWTVFWLAIFGISVVTSGTWAQQPNESTDSRPSANQQTDELSEEEAAILEDAWERIQLLRDRQRAELDRAAAQRAKSSDKSSKRTLDESQDGEAAEQWQESIESVVDERSEQLEESIEAWAEKFGADAEKWAEQFGQDMEQWAEHYSGDWEQWAEAHGEAWEQWAEMYGEKWEKWGQQFEEANVNADQLKEIVQQNLEMLQKMPLDELYEQISKSSKDFKDLPWDRLREMEDLVRDSIRHSLEGAEQAGQQENSAAQSARLRMLHDSLRQLHAGLDSKRAELDAAAAEMMSKMNKHKVKEEKARAEAARQRLIDEYSAQELYQRAAKNGKHALNDADKDRLRIVQQKLKQQYERIAQQDGDRQQEQAQQQIAELLDHAAKRSNLTPELRERIAAEMQKQQERIASTLRKEIAQRVAIDHHEENLDRMRAEIDALRAEIEALREQAKLSNEIKD